MFQRWKKAVIHLECAADSESLDQRIKRQDELQKKYESGEISVEELFLGLEGTIGRDVRYHGTAIFLKHNGRRYLVTAQHVIFDRLSAERQLKEDIEHLKSLPEHMRVFMRKSAQEKANMQVFNIIFRVPTLDEVLQGNVGALREFLMNIGSGPPECAPYTFSSPEYDLAIISLDQRDSKFADEIESLGYIPIELSDISQQPSAEGVEVFTVGFPEATAVIDKINQHLAIEHWSSSDISLPEQV